MSERSSDDAQVEPTTALAAPGATQAPEAPSAAQRESDAAAPERSRLAMWLPAALALLALAVSLFVAWQHLRLVESQGDSDGSLDAALAKLDERLGALDTELAGLTETQTELVADLATRGQRLAALTDRLGAVEDRLAAFARQRSSPGRELVIAETGQLLRLANRTLELARDSQSARAALETADRRLHELNDPGLLPVRNLIARELEALAGVELPDIEGYALTLGSLAQAVNRLPLKRPDTGSPGDDASIQPAESPSGWDRALSVVGDAFGRLVSVRRTEAAVTPLMAPEEEYFLRRNLELELAAARLALLDRQSASFREGLRSARSWLATYFDPGDAGVQSALETLARLESQPIEPRLPDISGSLALLESLSKRDGSGA